MEKEASFRPKAWVMYACLSRGAEREYRVSMKEGSETWSSEGEMRTIGPGQVSNGLLSLGGCALVWKSLDGHTVSLVHLADFKVVFAPFEYVVVDLIPQSYSGELGAGEL